MADASDGRYVLRESEYVSQRPGVGVDVAALREALPETVESIRARRLEQVDVAVKRAVEEAKRWR